MLSVIRSMLEVILLGQRYGCLGFLFAITHARARACVNVNKTDEADSGKNNTLGRE